MHAGKRDRLIKLQRAAFETQSASGEVTSEPETIEEVWAAVRPLSGREAMQFQAQQFQASLSVVFNIRYREDISPADKYQILYEGRPYDITAVIPPETAPRRSELDIFAFARAEALPTS